MSASSAAALNSDPATSGRGGVSSSGGAQTTEQHHSSHNRLSGWRRTRGRTREQENVSERTRTYVPPSLDNSTSSSASGASGQNLPTNYVTSPPRQRGITGGFGTLFRRAASRERGTLESRSSMQELSPIRPAKDDDVVAQALDELDAAGTPPVTKKKSKKSKSRSSQKPKGALSGHEKQASSRLFASSHDDSDDSYESRVSAATSTHGDDDDSLPGRSAMSIESLQRHIIRYRGFSTSIQSLFLDESLVCASIGCFGLILSNRTEYLMEIRDAQRRAGTRFKQKKTSKSQRLVSKLKSPSKIVGYILLLTLILMGLTFVVFGFGSSTNGYLGEYYDYDMMDDADRLEDDGLVYYQDVDDDGRYVRDDAVNNDDKNNYNYDDDQKNDDQKNDDDANNDDGRNDEGDDDMNNGRLLRLSGDPVVEVWSTKHRILGICKLRDYEELIWEPLISYISEEWKDLSSDSFLELHAKHHRGLGDTSDNSKDLGASVRLVLGLTFLLILAVLGRRRRIRTRYAIAKARAQDDHLHYAASLTQRIITNEDNYEGACSHTLFGCYPRDPPDMQIPDEEKSEPGEKKRKHQDFVARSFECLMTSCCGFLCNCWFQCMSVCALAQEAREVRLLIPPRLQRIDFITHQPFADYQEAVNDLRRGWLGKTRRKAGFLPHIQALSKLSRYIIISFTSIVITIVATLVFNPRATFTWADAVVLVATFVQSFLVLYIIHWIFHKSDLSLDAVVKFFAMGFVIASPSAFFFEGLLANLILAVLSALSAIVKALNWMRIVKWVNYHQRMLWILRELFNAYIVAAITEELCKYYTFRTVEHPDLIFLTGLDRTTQDERAYDGGVAQYPYGAHQVANLNRDNSFDESISTYRSNSSSIQNSSWIQRNTTMDEFVEDQSDVRTYRQKAAAVTTGMISVAVGLACAENFLYVFMLGGAGGGADENGRVMEEWIVLFFRSIFPVHALVAAMQSINMIRKFVECTGDVSNHRIGVGRIILPAVLLHGSFDAVLLGINVYVTSAWEKFAAENDGNIEDNGEPYNPVIVNLVAWLSIICIMAAGIMWYFREHRNQVQRLQLIEEAEKSEYTSPTKPSRMELL